MISTPYGDLPGCPRCGVIYLSTGAHLCEHGVEVVPEVELTLTISIPIERPMTETITAITPYEGHEGYHKEAGFQVRTNEQLITLAIEDESSCCEQWGYFLSEDDIAKFVGSDLLGVSITDMNLTSHSFIPGDGVDDKNAIHLDEGDTLFVNIETTEGKLQFAAYNAHNGYYGHKARVSSLQLEHQVVL